MKIDNSDIEMLELLTYLIIKRRTCMLITRGWDVRNCEPMMEIQIMLSRIRMKPETYQQFKNIKRIVAYPRSSFGLISATFVGLQK